MQLVENRRFIRHPLTLPLSFTITGKKMKKGPKEPQSKSINISLGGLLFTSKIPVDPEARIVIKMPFENKVFNVRAKVVRCIHNSETKFFDIAVSFLRAQEAFKAKMIEQIYLIASYRDMLVLQSGKDVSLEEASRKWIKRFSARFKRLYW